MELFKYQTNIRELSRYQTKFAELPKYYAKSRMFEYQT